MKKIKSNKCKIDYDVLPVPKLVKRCKSQIKLKGDKCIRNKCRNVSKVLSSDDNFLGNVVIVDYHGKKLVVKWNRFSEERENMLFELKLQNVAYTLGLAPKIIESYEDGKYFFIIMENLIEKGYNTIYNLYMKKILDEYWDGDGSLDDLYIPTHVIKLIGRGLKKLHKVNVAHGDLHPQNVFYNPREDKIMFIDFGHARRYSSREEARDNEKYNFTYWVTYYGSGSTLPKNWKKIAKYC